MKRSCVTHVTNRKYDIFFYQVQKKKTNLKDNFGVEFGAHKSHSLWLKQKMSWYILFAKKKKEKIYNGRGEERKVGCV